jgi:hypothetical protein
LFFENQPDVALFATLIFGPGLGLFAGDVQVAAGRAGEFRLDKFGFLHPSRNTENKAQNQKQRDQNEMEDGDENRENGDAPGNGEHLAGPKNPFGLGEIPPNDVTFGAFVAPTANDIDSFTLI